MKNLEQEHFDVIESMNWIIDLHSKNLKMAIEMLQGSEEENNYLYMMKNKEERVIDYMDLVIFSLDKVNDFIQNYIEKTFAEKKKEKAVNTKPLPKD